MVSILSNSGAMSAQRNLESANSDVQSSISRLSSGKRIVKASDDVAGLAVGTILQTNISTLKAASTNASQALSLLGLADGALSNIAQILQRQKALASQATSGSLDDVARGFLNQEFQNLKKEVDRIADSTNFNGIKLINGSIYNPSDIETDSRANSTTASAVLKIDVNPFASTDTLVINGQTLNFKTTANMVGGDADLSSINITVNSTAATQRTEILNRLNQIQNYSGTLAAILTNKEALAELEFTAGTNNDEIIITSKSAGLFGNEIAVKTTGTAANDILLDGADVSNGTTVDLGDAGVVAVSGALAGGTFDTGAATGQYSGTATTIANGFKSGSTTNVRLAGDNIIFDLDVTDSTATGLNLAGISNNPAFLGKIPEIKAIYNSDNVVDLEVKVGDFTYRANSVYTDYQANTFVTLSSVEDGGGFFKLRFKSGNGFSATTDPVNNQAKANEFADRLNSALSTMSAFQYREISSFKGAGSIFAEGETTANGDLTGSDFYLISDDFANVTIDDVKVVAPAPGATSPEIEFTINGEVYKGGFDYDGSALALTSNTIDNTFGGGNAVDSDSANNGLSVSNFWDGRFSFVNQSNPNKMLVWDYGSSTVLDIRNTAKALALENKLKDGFGIGANNGEDAALSFQIGTSSADTIKVQIESTNASNIYRDENGVFQNLSISTQADAEEAGTVLDIAINKVTSVRSNVGSLQSRFEFASSNINSSISNTDAARSGFLDTEIASESTDLAQSTVRLQASISVLSQANQIPQQLLKLIG